MQSALEECRVRWRSAESVKNLAKSLPPRRKFQPKQKSDEKKKVCVKKIILICFLNFCIYPEQLFY